jgi:trimethylamine:corrinoid methyltransferase-like protein
MSEKIKSISNPRLSLNILDADEIQRIHTATLDVIKNTGVRFPSIKALDIWAGMCQAF